MKQTDEMKKRALHHQRFHRRFIDFTKKVVANRTIYVILLLVSCALGYVSSPTFRNNSPPPNFSKPSNFELANLPNQPDNFRVTTQCDDSIPPETVRELILERIFDGTSPYSNFPPPHVSNLLRPRSIKGWGSYGVVFERLINKVKPRVIIEIGTFLGASALHMANLTRQLGLDTQILCIDDFRAWPGFRDKFKDIQMVNGDVLLYYQFLQNVIYLNATESVLPVPFSTGSALTSLCEWGVAGDLIEVDAGHDFNSAWADINRAWRILRRGGVIFGHDYFLAADNRGVRRAVDLFAKINGLQVQAVGQHWVIDSSTAVN